MAAKYLKTIKEWIEAILIYLMGMVFGYVLAK